MPELTAVRVTAALLIGCAVVVVLLPLPQNLWAWLYLALIVVTAQTLRGLRREPGAWLGRRRNRRALVSVLGAICVAVAAVPPPASGGLGSLAFLLPLLILLNIALGQATRRLATAGDRVVDEREEALRNRAHLIAYWMFAIVVGGVVVIADLVSQRSRSWVGSAFINDGWIVFFELLFLLPAMVVAWLEPDHLHDERATRPQAQRARLAAALLALTFGIPLALSVAAVVLPAQTTSLVSVDALDSQYLSAGPAARSTSTRVLGCKAFSADLTVGRGIGATLPLRAVACWNGRSASEMWGLNNSDCQIISTVLATVTVDECSRTTDAQGTLRFTLAGIVHPALLPFLGRGFTLQLVLDRNGNVVRFP
jgi:hypothetical protein